MVRTKPRPPLSSCSQNESSAAEHPTYILAIKTLYKSELIASKVEKQLRRKIYFHDTTSIFLML